MAFIKKIKKLKKSVKITGGVIIGVIVVFAIFSFYYRDKWYPNTSINGIDVSSMTYEESKNVLKNQIESYALEIGAEGNQKLTIAGKDINLSADFEKNLESDYKNHRSQRSIFGIFSGYNHDIDLKISYDQNKLSEIVNGSVLINGNEEYQIVQSTNAHIEYDETTKSGKWLKQQLEMN